MRGRDRLSADRAFLLFAAAFFVFHQAWVLFAVLLADVVIALLTPLAVVGAAAMVLRALGTTVRTGAMAIVAAIVYVHGRGAHSAANSIQGTIDAPIVTFWDERYGHIVSVAGWLGLLAAFALAERSNAADRPASGGLLAVAAGVLGWAVFVTTIEGQTWWALPPAAVAFGVWAARARRPLLSAIAGALGLALVLLAVWAAWHGGVPQLTTA